MQLFGVVNASPDSLHEESVATTPADAVARARRLLSDGANAIDVGGQGSTDIATVVSWQEEWARLEAVIPALAALGVGVSVDTWKPEVAARALAAGANTLNAADGMQTDAMWEIAAEHGVPIVVPFLSGPDPRSMSYVTIDPIEAISDFFETRLRQAERYGVRDKCILDPGTGFAPSNWPWDERYQYQKIVYTRLDELRRFGLPLYVALPWRRTVQHDELLEIVVAKQPEYGRVHYPERVREVERRLGLT